jgi:hypothetical protein
MPSSQNTHMTPTGPRSKAYIANVGPSEFFVSRTYGHFQLLPCPKHLPYAITIIEDREDRLDMGDEHYYWIPIAARDIALDIVRNEGFDQHGCIVLKGPKPTPAELDEAQLKMLTYYRRKIAEADAEWARYHKYEVIDDNARRACLALGEQREWAYQVVQRLSCPGCGDSVLATIARHSCGYILDIDRALAGGLIEEHQAKRLKALRAKEKPAAKPQPPPTATEDQGAGDELPTETTTTP